MGSPKQILKLSLEVTNDCKDLVGERAAHYLRILEMSTRFGGKLWRGGPMTGGCVQAQASAHALLPCTLFFFDFFDLVECGGQWFATELPHL